MSEDNLISALAKAQAKMNNAAFNRENPHFRSRYADLAAIRDATIPALSAHGLAIIQYTMVNSAGELFLCTRLAHSGGQFVESVYPLPLNLDKPQIMGSALTYAKRYCWSSMCGIAADDDDDAEAATTRKSSHQAKKDGDWQVLQTEMNAIKTAQDLKAWGATNVQRIQNLPTNWQEHFRDEYDRRMGLFKGTEGVKKIKKSDIKEQLKASVKATTAEIIDDEIPIGDPDKYLDDLEAQLSAASDVDQINEVWEEYKLVMSQLFPPDRDKADKLFDKHQTRVEKV